MKVIEICQNSSRRVIKSENWVTVDLKGITEWGMMVVVVSQKVKIDWTCTLLRVHPLFKICIAYLDTVDPEIKLAENQVFFFDK